MFTEHIYEFQTQQKELHNQAAHYRLENSLERKNSFADRLTASIGRLMVKSGRGLLDYAQAAR